MFRTPTSPASLALALVALAATACSDPASAPPAAALELAPQTAVRAIPVSSLGEATFLAQEAHLRCEIPGGCPEAVGQLVVPTLDTVFTCTAFLLTESTFATNSHCVPGLAKGATDLSDRGLRLVLPASGIRPEESLPVAELLGASERPNAISPDLALFRLAEPSARRPLPFAQTGVAPGSALKAWKVNPGPAASGVLVEASCLSVDRNYRFPLYRSAGDPVLVAGGCESIPGNSGSPLVNSAGQAVALLQAGLPLAENARRVWEPHLEPGETFAPLALATSLHCLRSASAWNWDEACGPLDDLGIVRPRPEDFPASAKVEGLEFLRWSFDPTALRALALVREETFAPLCLEQNWAEHFQELDTLLSGSAPIPVVETRLSFNRYLQVSARHKILRQETKRFEILLPRLERSSAQLLWANGAPQDLPLCEN